MSHYGPNAALRLSKVFSTVAFHASFDRGLRYIFRCRHVCKIYLACSQNPKKFGASKTLDSLWVKNT